MPIERRCRAVIVEDHKFKKRVLEQIAEYLGCSVVGWMERVFSRNELKQFMLDRRPSIVFGDKSMILPLGLREGDINAVVVLSSGEGLGGRAREMEVLAWTLGVPVGMIDSLELTSLYKKIEELKKGLVDADAVSILTRAFIELAQHSYEIEWVNN